MLKHGSPSRHQGQWSLIGTMVAVTIIVVLAALYLPRLIRPQGRSAGDQSTVIQRANGTACTMYMSQFTAAVVQYKQDHDGQSPRSMEDLKTEGVTDDMIHSPGCAFQMDPATGNVTNGPPPAAAPAAPAAPGAPVTIGAPAPSGAPPPNGGTRGPGGVTIPNIPTSGGGM